MPHHVKSPPAPKTNSPSARIKTIFGTNSLSLVGYKRLLRKHDIVIVFDNRGEIERAFAGFTHPNLITVELGDGETALSLVTDASPELKACMERLPGISTTFGMAQIRAIGGCATGRLV